MCQKSLAGFDNCQQGELEMRVVKFVNYGLVTIMTCFVLLGCGAGAPATGATPNPTNPNPFAYPMKRASCQGLYSSTCTDNPPPTCAATTGQCIPLGTTFGCVYQASNDPVTHCECFQNQFETCYLNGRLGYRTCVIDNAVGPNFASHWDTTVAPCTVF